ncbi:MAG: hypothetical protein QM755_05185 [Luteolibacter sp.]
MALSMALMASCSKKAPTAEEKEAADAIDEARESVRLAILQNVHDTAFMSIKLRNSPDPNMPKVAEDRLKDALKAATDFNMPQREIDLARDHGLRQAWEDINVEEMRKKHLDRQMQKAAEEKVPK